MRDSQGRLRVELQGEISSPFVRKLDDFFHGQWRDLLMISFMDNGKTCY